jgi:hypothetical protein
MTTEQGTEASAVAERVELLRRTMLKPDKAAFEDLLADALSYGHTTGVVETKADVMDGMLSGRTVFSMLEQPEQTISFSGDIAIVRHRFNGENVSSGKTNSPRIRVVQAWQKQNGRWRLLVRQGF